MSENPNILKRPIDKLTLCLLPNLIGIALVPLYALILGTSVPVYLTVTKTWQAGMYQLVFYYINFTLDSRHIVDILLILIINIFVYLLIFRDSLSEKFQYIYLILFGFAYGFFYFILTKYQYLPFHY
jgi:hypothetical protein